MLGNNKIRTIIYPDEKYGVVFNQEIGFFLRKEFPNYSEPFMSHHGVIKDVHFATKNLIVMEII